MRALQNSSSSPVAYLPQEHSDFIVSVTREPLSAVVIFAILALAATLWWYFRRKRQSKIGNRKRSSRLGRPLLRARRARQ
jgi:cell division protein FtsW (lipid II flippase)